MIRVLDYDPKWPARFRVIRDRIWPSVSGVASSIEHVGSTAVEGLAAKPIIDIDIVIPGASKLPAVRASLEELGYEYRGDLGIADRHAFRAPPDEADHHVYVCLEGCVALANHLMLREHLRSQPADVAAYSEIKRRLAAAFPDQIDRYVEGKSEFILAILAGAGLSVEQQTAIREANRAK